MQMYVDIIAHALAGLMVGQEFPHAGDLSRPWLFLWMSSGRRQSLDKLLIVRRNSLLIAASH